MKIQGLQNVGLLALEGENGSVKRDTWASSFRDVVYALDYPQQVGEPPVVTTPDVIPGGQVHIPDPNLRAAIAEALGKSPNAPITALEMTRLRDLDLRDRDVRDLTGLQFATNLRELWAHGNNLLSDLSPLRGLTNLTELGFDHSQVSDISPVAGLINLRHLGFRNTNVSDVSPLAGLINLTFLGFPHNQIPDISPVAGLINLVHLDVGGNNISDLSPVAGLINLRTLHFGHNNISDLSPLARLTKLEHLSFTENDVSDIAPLAGLVNLERITTWGNRFSNLSSLARLKKLEILNICGAEVSDLSPLSGLTGLKELYLIGNGITDISLLARLTGLTRLSLVRNDISNLSPLTRLTNLKWLDLAHNNISNLSPLAGLINLKWLGVHYNKITDFSPLDGLHQIGELLLFNNPGFPTGGPKIEGPWLWFFLPDTKLRLDDTDLLAEASGGSVTELKIATQGATEGKAVGDDVWTSDKLPPTGRDNLDDMLGRALPDGVMYGTVFLYSPREQNTTMYLGCEQEVKVWLNGVLIYKRKGVGHGGKYTDFFPATLRQGRNVLLVAGGTQSDGHSNAFFGFELGTEYTLGTGIGYAFSNTPIHIGDTFTLDIRAENVFDLAGWQFDIAFDPTVLEAVGVSEGDFLQTDGGTTFFQGGRIDNAAGKITGLIAGRISEGGVSGSGSVLQVRFKAKAEGETVLTLQKLRVRLKHRRKHPCRPP